MDMDKWLTMGRRLAVGVAATGLLALAACAPPPAEAPPPPVHSGAASGAAPVSNLSGSIKIDGSSTVGPISSAVAEEFRKTNPNVQVSVGVSGTGGGMKKFAAAEIDICDASRPIHQAELDSAKTKGIDVVELPVAFDGIAVVVNPENTWVDKLTVAELKKIWEPNSAVKTWQDVRPAFPAEPIKLFGPGTESGTFEYFTEEVVGTAKASRTDYTQSEDDNVLVKGVEGEKGALGYFGHAYYEQNKSALKLVPVDNGSGPVVPDATTIANGTYKPLSRPLFIYVVKSALDRPEVAAFVKYYLDQMPTIAPQVGYVALPEETLAKVKLRAESKVLGSVMKDAAGKTLDTLLSAADVAGKAIAAGADAAAEAAVDAGKVLKDGAVATGKAAADAAADTAKAGGIAVKELSGR